MAKSRKEILKMLWDDIDEGDLKPKERLEYIKEINKLEALYKDKKQNDDVKVEIVSFEGMGVGVCPHCGEAL
jgi:hypothetical protein